MTRYMEPLPGRYASDDPFGNIRPNGRPHLGSDYPAPAGTPFAVVADGEVVANQWSTVLGWVLGIRHADGKYFGYSHQLGRSPLLIGQRVAIGQTGGYVGNTGSASQGNHLHISCGDTPDAIFGVGVEDPYAYIIARSTGAAGGGGSAITEEENDMNRILIVADARGGRIVKGQRFYQGADQVLYPLTKRQYEIDARCHPNAIWTEWTGDDAVAHVKNVGLFKYTPDLSVKGGVGKLTGPVIYDL